MASIATGESKAVRFSQELIFDPQSGDQLVETWYGTKKAIYALLSAFKGAGGVKVTVSNDGPKYKLVAIFSALGLSSGTVEVPVDKWQIQTEWAQVDIRQSPKLLDKAGGNKATLNLAYDLAKKAIATPTTEAPLFAVEAAISIYNLLTHGADSYEVKRCVLTRVRTISPSYSQQVVIDATEKIYSTSTLVAAYGVPGTIAARLPTNPNQVITDAAWAWKERKQTSEFTLALGKVEEQNDWVFGLWSTVLYDVV